ncbi:MAG: cytochrome c [Defluviimonas sp.]|nr:cytochrome c [Defluviimonas sp.]
MRPLLAAALATALMPLPLRAGPVEDGRAVWLDACASCHGPAARGDGPMAEILAMPVPDLTGLTAANGGSFPWLRVVHLVDGRSGLRGHGGPMPIFGALMRGDAVAADAPDGTPVITSARVLAVVAWLESVQER